MEHSQFHSMKLVRIVQLTNYKIMKMKNIKLLLLSLSSLFIVSCGEEYADYTAPQDNFEDVSWLAGLNPLVGADSQFSLNADSSISFFNLAQGANSSQWILQEGNHFLNEGFTQNDSLPLFIDSNLGTTSTNDKAHVLFRTPGENKVTLINTFDTEVTSNMSDTYEDYVKEEMTQENGEYTYKVEFVFDIYDYLNPAFTVEKEGTTVLTITESDNPSLADQANWDVVEVEAATGLTFIDNSTQGRPNGGTWFVADGVPSRASAAQPVNINFYKLGTFNVGSFRSLRVAPLPTSNREKLIPLKVKVVQSTQPFNFDGVLTEDENELISFRVNGELTPFSEKEGNFSARVTNPNGFDQVVPVESVRVNDENPIFMQVKLSQPIYNSDTVELSYDGNGAITSADNRVLQAFGPEVVAMHYGNSILPANSLASFEPSGGNHTNAFATNKYWMPGGGGATGNWRYGAGNEIWARSEFRAYAGGASMKYEIPAEATELHTLQLYGFGLADGPDGIPAGTYRVFHWIYVEPQTTINELTFGFGPNQNYAKFDISSIAKGQWVRVRASNDLVIASDLTGASGGAKRNNTAILPGGNNAGVSGEQVLYIDELEFIEVEVRP